MMVTNYW